MNPLRELLLSAYGSVNAFRSLDENTADPQAEIRAAKETAIIAERFILAALKHTKGEKEVEAH